MRAVMRSLCYVFVLSSAVAFYGCIELALDVAERGSREAPEPAMRDAGIENMMMEKARSMLRAGDTAVNAAIPSDGCIVFRNETTGVPVCQKLYGAVNVRTKREWCYFVPFILRREHLGGGTYGGIQIEKFDLVDKKDITCDKLSGKKKIK
jgi:hypothetical protein